MSLRRFVHLVALITTGLMTLPFLKVGAQQPRSVPIDFGKRDIAGVVASSKGPEAGVWVIAETMELPTKFVRIVVTDDQGRYLIPDLPQANYHIFIRGYGLLDSERQPAKPGQRLDIKAEVAPDARRAAQVYPAAWWLSVLTLPTTRNFIKNSQWTSKSVSIAIRSETRPLENLGRPPLPDQPRCSTPGTAARGSVRPDLP